MAIDPAVPADVPSGEADRNIRILRYEDGRFTAQTDAVALEEPLEIRLEYGSADQRRSKSIAITMRTPGDDFALAAGFLMTEGILADSLDIEEILYLAQSRAALQSASAPADGDFDEASARNVVLVRLTAEAQPRLPSVERNFYVTSSCGVCGKASLLALRSVCPAPVRSSVRVPVSMLLTLPEKMRAAQTGFAHSGGIHASGLFDAEGQLLLCREDVGRHNALDKLIGRMFLDDLTPLRDKVLLLSGRASYELLQKSVMAGIPIVVAIGAPSSLAVRVARMFDITLLAFLRHDRCNIYHGAERLIA
ncbi:formate dehydrogenase accessory sulfurtransferase FdhD [Silvibacterium dinghuense]|uniref:Sulfur carrier protein FdhD n=1 Tax=Silvibacterium dinghuense TaxID=1560006 RepID=A0A4Q1SB27_9BACT|nr:formate dehydrogenase accessory sulfurtransferase FdhD [Silvibacterium dinghuense]RXS93882.1 formate dehydrogenase accessory sulfurtransferase FdhD [Silvibacterium dinghuense]GGH08461.1 sulfurtransferase FdhD [Silvibacterium dinghuense]